MVTDCLFYQTDILAGDANMALYRYGGSNQKSMDIQGGMYQSIIAYFLEAYKKQSLPFCCPKVRHVSANSLYVLEQHEDALGQPFRDCPPIDWNVFPGLDPLVCSIFEWGHSLTDDEWSEIVGEPAEYRLGVSEWVLNSDQSNYLLGDRDNDSHTPLLVDILPQHVLDVLLNLKHLHRGVVQQDRLSLIILLLEKARTKVPRTKGKGRE